jgi:pimeloyl-ACP methyl ester carboxylesterase
VASLRIDFRGNGESEGKFEVMTMEGLIADAEAALDYLAASPDVDRDKMAIVGWSMGGAVGAVVSQPMPRWRLTTPVCRPVIRAPLGWAILPSSAIVALLRVLWCYPVATPLRGPAATCPRPIISPLGRWWRGPWLPRKWTVRKLRGRGAKDGYKSFNYTQIVKRLGQVAKINRSLRKAKVMMPTKRGLGVAA